MPWRRCALNRPICPLKPVGSNSPRRPFRLPRAVFSSSGNRAGPQPLCRLEIVPPAMGGKAQPKRYISPRHSRVLKMSTRLAAYIVGSLRGFRFSLLQRPVSAETGLSFYFAASRGQGLQVGQHRINVDSALPRPAAAAVGLAVTVILRPGACLVHQGQRRFCTAQPPADGQPLSAR